MKRLFVLRHAKSSWASPELRDFDRPLNQRGRTAARLIGREMRARSLRPELVLASPARRVTETLDGLAKGLGATLQIHWDDRIYGASVAELAGLVREADDSTTNLLLVGHNPGLQRLILDLSNDDDGPLRHEVSAKFPTAALAEIEVDAKSWKDVGLGRGRLVGLIRPRDLA